LVRSFFYKEAIMETANQAQVPEPANPNEPLVQGAQEQVPANSVLPPEAQQYVVAPATEPANAPQAQAPAQEQPQTGVTELQRLLNQRQIENYQLQQQLQAQQQAQQQAPRPDTNPFDPTTQWEQWDSWRMQKAINDAVQTNTRQLASFAQQQYQQQEEMKWQQAHPTVDINLVKEWGQQNGVNNLNHAFTLMTLPNAIQTAQTNGAQQAFQQFQQPTNVPAALRGSQTAGGQAGLSYEAMAKDFQATNGRVYESWHPDLRKAFDQETAKRDYFSRQRQ
jgi:hypothetical protein